MKTPMKDKKCACYCHIPKYEEDVRDDEWEASPCNNCRDNHKDTMKSKVSWEEDISKILIDNDTCGEFGQWYEAQHNKVLKELSDLVSSLLREERERVIREVIEKIDSYEEWHGGCMDCNVSGLVRDEVTKVLNEI